ncbi:stalk domain-containing protein [Anaerotignum faecicola]|uniref:Copper amine oxidase-like N-terminal domain-containing protein n=1 Tax=Anaerotignum faecicola TaxID=2358141 RepID=A0A401LFD3_9FIRM|nr:hypothetical protein [Anaerotignum faecicola]GCB30281.1 hypothetical protein KGMB03357_19420 [Anaerotignum faecicola]
MAKNTSSQVKQVALDVPAYISAAGYTMLPVRAVLQHGYQQQTTFCGAQASRTVTTCMYGQRIITMVAGQKVVTVNGNTIPRIRYSTDQRTAEHSCL